jgi:hypothetical protein
MVLSNIGSARRRAHAARRLRRLAILGIVAASGCGDSADPVPPCGAFGSATAPELSVGAGLTPTFTWSPNCVVTRLYVTRGDLSFGEPVWDVELPSDPSGFASGVVYGRAPRGAIVRSGPVPLEAGAGYVVSVSFNGPTSAVRPFSR